MFITSCLDHITSQHALQKQVRRPLHCCCKFYVAATSSKQEAFLPTTQNQNGFIKFAILTFNKDRPQSNSIQLKLEKQTPANHLYAKLVACLSVESQEHGHVRLVWAASSNNTA